MSRWITPRGAGRGACQPRVFQTSGALWIHVPCSTVSRRNSATSARLIRVPRLSVPASAARSGAPAGLLESDGSGKGPVGVGGADDLVEAVVVVVGGLEFGHVDRTVLHERLSGRIKARRVAQLLTVMFLRLPLMTH